MSEKQSATESRGGESGRQRGPAAGRETASPRPSPASPIASLSLSGGGGGTSPGGGAGAVVSAAAAVPAPASAATPASPNPTSPPAPPNTNNPPALAAPTPRPTSPSPASPVKQKSAKPRGRPRKQLPPPTSAPVHSAPSPAPVTALALPLAVAAHPPPPHSAPHAQRHVHPIQFHPYPPPRMSHSAYPVNGSPPYGAHPAAPPAGAQPAPAGAPHYGAAAHAPPPPPYGYHPMQYAGPQYHAYHGYYPVAGYSPPPPPPPAQAQPHAAPPEASASSPGAGKRKRKGTLESGAKGKGSVSDTEESSDMHKKRTKTQRACDSCRSRKIRCDVLADAEPPVCQHCKQYGFECTFFLPITETRFKKKRLEEEAQAQAAQAAQQRQVSAPADKVERSVEPEGSQKSPLPEGTRNMRIDGPTSMTHLLHSTATVPPRAYHLYDQRYNHTWEVSKTGDGLIQVHELSTVDSPSVLPKPIDSNVERDVIEKLINSYFTDIAPLVPIITQAEFLELSTPSPPPILLYSICVVAASRRDVPQTVFDALRLAVNEVIKSEDVLCTANIVNVQSLLILCQCADCHSQHVPNALSALWIRLGTAIRMAQDLGLHRAEAVKQNIEMRRRVWAACVITDRWTSLTYGHPYMIDVEDCDARLPSSGDPDNHYNDELLRLSLILGRVLKTIYGPSGLTYATDEKLHALLEDMRMWKERLPDDLKFRGPSSPRSAGLLHLLYAAVSMIFWRVFMRISYQCPEHLKFSLSIDQWSELMQFSGDSIDWLDTHEHVYDVWMLVPYAATSCALVQYHTWARRKDANAQTKLKKLRDCVRRWESCLQPNHMSTRRKTAEIITLLYETTLGPPSLDHPPGLNPTSGVITKPQGKYGDLKYKSDPSRPGSGVFVVSGAKGREEDFKRLPAGTVVVKDSNDDGGGEDSELGEDLAAPESHAQRSASTANNDTDDDYHRHNRDETFTPPSSSGASAYSHPHMQYSHTRTGAPSLAPLAVSANRMAAATVAARRASHDGAQSSSLASPMGPHTPTTPSSLQQHQQMQQQQHAHTGGYQQGGGFADPYLNNVNPSLNNTGAASGNITVMNVLEANPQPNVLEQMQLVDSGLLAGIPGGMFDWPQWEHFFARFNTSGATADPNALAAYAQAQHQRQTEQNLAINGGFRQQQQYPS